jgi:hypothetical protein
MNFCLQFNQFSEHNIKFCADTSNSLLKKKKTFNLNLKEPTLETLFFSSLLLIPEENYRKYWRRIIILFLKV